MLNVRSGRRWLKLKLKQPHHHQIIIHPLATPGWGRGFRVNVSLMGRNDLYHRLNGLYDPLPHVAAQSGPTRQTTRPHSPAASKRRIRLGQEHLVVGALLAVGLLPMVGSVKAWTAWGSGALSEGGARVPSAWPHG